MDKHVVNQLGAAAIFSVGYGAFEYHILNESDTGLNIIKEFGAEPIAYNLYPYHLYFMLPIVAGTALAISWNKDPLRTYLNFFQTFPMLAAVEDAAFFVFRGMDKERPETFGKIFPTPQDWTSNHLGGYIKISEDQVIPVWYLGAGAIAAGAWLVDNVVFKEGKKKEQMKVKI